tara:strand:- start:1011 stop:2249 length:1239 start_codon:yes stop_codon:yes gene_type:complete
MKLNLNIYIHFFLIIIIPFTLVLGSSASLINTILICLILFYLLIKDKNFSFIKKEEFLFLIFIYGYLILNTLISLDPKIGALRNLGFLRLILFFLVINYFVYKYNYSSLNKIFTIWIFFILFIIIDSFIEFYFGKNIFGFGGQYGNRIVSFFKDEPIVASYLNGFALFLIGFFFDQYYFKNNYFKFLFYIFVILFFSCILITGERSNTLKAIFALSIFFYLNPYLNLKSKIFVTLGMIIIFTLIFYNSKYIKYRYFDYFIPFITGKDNVHFISNNNYIILYKSGYEVFKNYPYFGVGNKNYRVETKDIKKNKHYKNNSHPHQIYLEFLSEHGIIGTIILLSLFFLLIFRNLKIIILTKNSVQLGAFAYLVSVFLPIIPSGSFFNNFNISLFFLNLSILYACNSKTNLFQKSS